MKTVLLNTIAVTKYHLRLYEEPPAAPVYAAITYYGTTPKRKPRRRAV